MYIFLTILIALISIALVFIVTIQNSKGGGLASGFSASNQYMGVRRTTDLLEKVTWGLATVMIVLCIVAVRFAPSHTSGNAPRSVISEQVEKATTPVGTDALPFGDAKTNAPEAETAPAEATPSEETPASEATTATPAETNEETR